MQEQSPNWYWQQLGAHIERDGWHRTVTVSGHVVCVNAGYDAELAISRWLFDGGVI